LENTGKLVFGKLKISNKYILILPSPPLANPSPTGTPQAGTIAKRRWGEGEKYENQPKKYLGDNHG